MPLIAETGGINAMIVDATALPEQVTDDVVTSAFRSAGQRCSALRLLCVQEDVADRIIEMIEGAARALVVGDPREIATHVGPVIDAEAKEKLDSWIAAHAEPRASSAMTARRPPARSCRRPSSRSTARATSPRRCSARCCMWCAGAPNELDRVARRHRRQRLRPDARHPFAHRRHRRAHRARGSRTAMSTSTAT